MLQAKLDAAGLTGWQTEFRFHPVRRWRFDFAHPEKRVAVEIEGGVFIRGRHNRPSGFIADCEKYNEAVKLGWRVLRVVPRGKGDLWAVEALLMVNEVLK